MNENPTSVVTINRIEPGDEATQLARAMYDRLLDELGALEPGAWDAPTVCDGWSVADVVRHLVGAAKGHASMPEMIRQAVHGRRHKRQFDGNDMDAMNALQVDDHADLGPSELVAELRRVAPKAVAKRMARPRFMHRIRLPNAPGGSTASGMPDRLRLGHLLTVILTRDVFLHRIDIARATGNAMVVDGAEARIVADVVGEWARRHGEPFHLVLDGAAGGEFSSVGGGPELCFDALEFCWILSGRSPAPSRLLETRVLF